MIPTTALCNTASGRLGARLWVGWWVLSLSLCGVAEAYRTRLRCHNFSTSSLQNSWMAAPCPCRGLGDTCAPAMLHRREPRGGLCGGRHTEPDVLWTGNVSISVCLLASESIVCLCTERRNRAGAQLPKPKHTERGRKQEEGEIQNSSEQLADKVT